MSIEYLICERCEKTFADCSGYTVCESCNTHWCSDECAEEDGYVREHCKLHLDLDDRDLMEEYREGHCNYDDCCDCPHYESASCKYCRKEDYDDSLLLNYCMELLSVTREELIEKYNNNNK